MPYTSMEFDRQGERIPEKRQNKEALGLSDEKQLTISLINACVYGEGATMEIGRIALGLTSLRRRTSWSF